MRVAISASVRPGHVEELERELRAGPPFDLAAAGFDRHEVYLDEREVVFVFEGRDPVAALRSLTVERMRDVMRLSHAVSNPHLHDMRTPWERPHLPLRYSWTRTPKETTPGVAYLG
jgi:hypothetical protein